MTHDTGENNDNFVIEDYVGAAKLFTAAIIHSKLRGIAAGCQCRRPTLTK